MGTIALWQGWRIDLDGRQLKCLHQHPIGALLRRSCLKIYSFPTENCAREEHEKLLKILLHGN